MAQSGGTACPFAAEFAQTPLIEFRPAFAPTKASLCVDRPLARQSRTKLGLYSEDAALVASVLPEVGACAEIGRTFLEELKERLMERPADNQGNGCINFDPDKLEIPHDGCFPANSRPDIHRSDGSYWNRCAHDSPAALAFQRSPEVWLLFADRGAGFHHEGPLA